VETALPLFQSIAVVPLVIVCDPVESRPDALMFPLTSSFSPGLTVPMPTLQTYFVKAFLPYQCFLRKRSSYLW
jgi:hypothetical protein